MQTKQDVLNKILAHTEQPVLSLYQATVRKGPDVEQGPIQFKNLLREVSEPLKSKVDRDRYQSLMDQLDKIQRDGSFWQNRSEALGLFAWADTIEQLDLNHPVEDYVTVSDRPDILPLIEALEGEGACYVLDLQKDDFTVYQVEGETFQPLDHEDLPKNFAELFDDFDNDADLNVGSYAGKEGAYHGHRAKSEEAEKDKEKYYRYLAKTLTAFFREKGRPVVLAGVKENIADWRMIEDHPIYLKDELGKPVRDYGDDDLKEAVRSILKEHYNTLNEATMEQVAKALADQKATPDPKAIEDALTAARVQSLYIRDDYPRDMRATLNGWAIACIEQGGDVRIISSEVASMERVVMAQLRY